MIEPTWSAGDVQLYLGDCLEILPQLEAGSVDAVVTDPPYGIGENNEKNKSRSIKGGNDKWSKPIPIDYGDFNWDKKPATKEQINFCRAVSMEQVIFGGNYFELPPSPSWIIWDKMNGDSDYADCELAWTSHNRAARIFRYLWNGFQKEKPEKRYHPTQKPLALMLWVLENYTQDNDLILDPFMGSGTTGVACVQTGRKFIGVEIDEKYFEIAVKRISEAQLQMRLPI